MIYRRLLFPILKRLDAEEAHEQTLMALSLAQRIFPGPILLRLLAGPIPQQPIRLWGLVFPNVLGMAAGFDKDVRVVSGLAQLGFGHIEVGTLTPRPQMGNERPRIFRLSEDGGVINRMGFPNGGVMGALPRLQALSRQRRNYILGVSLGKQKETPLANAVDDYLAVMRVVYATADYLVVNVSSPNTPGLRDLQGGKYLEHLLGQLMAENELLSDMFNCAERPLLVKIAPDLSWGELDEILAAADKSNIHGIIATNTTVARPNLKSGFAHERGGLSGSPLQDRALEVVSYISQQMGPTLPIIGVGGIRTAGDVSAFLDAGASLVQLYTGLIYEGPKLIV